jgi:hypothetical protein
MNRFRPSDHTFKYLLEYHHPKFAAICRLMTWALSIARPSE